MIPELIAALQNANLEVTAEEIAEMLWLSLHMAHAHKVETTNSLDQGAEPLKLPEAPLPIDMTSPLQQLQAQPPQPSSKSEAVSNVHLHSQRPADMSNTQHPGLLFKSPAAPALPGSLSLARALRPLMRRLPSRTAFIFNERASVRLIAETHKKIWAPVLDAAPTRWFEVALVIDEGASMILWQQTIAELHTLLERQGAFRDVRVWRLATDTKDRVQINAGASSATKPQQARNPKELVDPTGRRLILVVTDCVSPAWHSGKVQEVLAMWGQKNVVTLVQMLPQRLWPRTSLCAANIVRVRASSPGVANARMKLSRSEQRQGEQSIPIPVVTLEQRSLAIWARMIMGKEGNWVSGAIFDKDTNSLMDDYPDTNQDKDSLTPKKRVQRFQKAASPLACKLAALLAATPISLPVIRLIQQIMLPESNQVHVAEILLGGLLEEIYPDENVIHPDYIEYDFLPGVRDELLNAISMPDAFQV